MNNERSTRDQCLRIVSASIDTLPDQFENKKGSGEFEVLQVKQDLEKLLKLYKLGLIDPTEELKSRLGRSKKSGQ